MSSAPSAILSLKRRGAFGGLVPSTTGIGSLLSAEIAWFDSAHLVTSVEVCAEL